MANTCATGTSSTASGGGGGGGGGGEIMLFGVRVVVDSMRKSVSMNNLSQYEQPDQELFKNNNKSSSNNNKSNKEYVAAGYASADDAVPNSSGGNRERKRGIPWTEDEHKLFLLGLQKVGKGDWRGISRNFVKTRTPTQVASHAQKYFLRRSNLNRRRRRRSSLFDITTDTVTTIPMEEEPPVHHRDNASQSPPLPPPPSEPNNVSGFHVIPAFPMNVNSGPLPVPIENPMENLTLGQANRANNASTKLIRPIPVAPHPSTISDLNLNLKAPMDPSPLSHKLSLPSLQRESSSSRHSAFQVMSNFSSGDGNSIIIVA